MDVIILDGEQKSALAAVRVLGRAGLRVVVGSTRSSAMAMHSRYALARFVYPDPKQDRAGFIAALTAEATRFGDRPVVMAFSEATAVTVQLEQSSLERHIRYAWQEPSQFEIVQNKAATYSEAKLLGVPVIPTYLFENVAELGKQQESFTWPMVIKPRRSVTKTEAGLSFGTAAFAHDFSELQRLFKEVKAATGEAPLVQPYIYGEEYGVSVLATQGEVSACVVHHRLRSLSPTGGASVLKETVVEGRLHDELISHASKLVSALQWSGPLMVECKVDADTGTPRLMEINGRWVGSLPLSVATGMPLPLWHYQQLVGEPVDILQPQNTVEVTTNYFLGDVRHLLRVLFGRSKMRSLVYPQRKKALRDFFYMLWRVQYDVWDWRDPLPSLWQYVDVVKR